MEVSDVRKRVKEVIDHAKRAMTERRALVDEATREYQVFLDRIATPLFRQIGNILRAEGHPFTVSTPGSSVRLVSDRSGKRLHRFVARHDRPPAARHHPFEPESRTRA